MLPASILYSYHEPRCRPGRVTAANASACVAENIRAGAGPPDLAQTLTFCDCARPPAAAATEKAMRAAHASELHSGRPILFS